MKSFLQDLKIAIFKDSGKEPFTTFLSYAEVLNRKHLNYTGAKLTRAWL
jgi:hypothetical protein